MNLELIRKEKYDDRTIGSLYLNNSFECFSLEDCDRELEKGATKIEGKTAIPRGKYQIVIDWSDRFKCLMTHILNVPQFTGIRIHAGNRPEDTEGCLIAGKKIDFKTKTLIHSIDALRDLTIKIYLSLLSGEDIWIEIT